MDVTIDASELRLAAADIRVDASDTHAQVRRLVRHYGGLLLTRSKANASGRPGPRAVTGDYRRSISIEFREHGASIEAEVGTNAPQGRRLELGFVGTDSIGRVYNQPPYPHFGPALDRTGPEFEAALRAL